jgi:hypothetical protein
MYDDQNENTSTPACCPQCGSDDVRIAVIIQAVYKPNDADFPFVDEAYIGLDADWDGDSDCWCNQCSWNGRPRDLIPPLGVEEEVAA